MARPGIASSRNISEQGAKIEFSTAVKLHKKQMSVAFARKGRSFLARVVWWRDNFVGVAFSSESRLPVSDLDERLRKSEQKSGQLSARIKELIGRRLNALPGRVLERSVGNNCARCARPRANVDVPDNSSGALRPGTLPAFADVPLPPIDPQLPKIRGGQE